MSNILFACVGLLVVYYLWIITGVLQEGVKALEQIVGLLEEQYDDDRE